MKKTILPALIALIVALPSLALAVEEKNGFSSVWLTGSITPQGKPGYGFGFRGINFGCEVSYNDTADYESNSVWVVPDASMMGASTPVGRKKIDASIGMDFMLIVNPIKNVLSIYGEGGPYYQETQDVFRQNNSGQLWSTKHNYGITGGGGGGMMLRIPTGSFIGFDGIQVSAGYHSIRGTTFSLGFTY